MIEDEDGEIEAPESPSRVPARGSKGPSGFLDALRAKLERHGVNWERLPKQSSLDVPPACFVFRFGDLDIALKEWHAWLALAADTDDIPYRNDQPGDANFCIDCTPEFRAQALAAGKCQFSNVRFESRVWNGEREMVGVSHAPEVPPAEWEIFNSMLVPLEALPAAIKRYRAKQARKKREQEIREGSS